MDEEIVMDSESFRDLCYIVKDKHLILKSSNNGMFAVSMKAIPELVKEIMEVHDVYGK